MLNTLAPYSHCRVGVRMQRVGRGIGRERGAESMRPAPRCQCSHDSSLTLLTMVLPFLSHSSGTLYLPLYSLSALKYTSCKYSLPNSLSSVAPGYSSSLF